MKYIPLGAVILLATAQLGAAQQQFTRKQMVELCVTVGESKTVGEIEECMNTDWGYEFSVKECPIGEYKADRPENDEWNTRATGARKFADCYVKVKDGMLDTPAGKAMLMMELRQRNLMRELLQPRK